MRVGSFFCLLDSRCSEQHLAQSGFSTTLCSMTIHEVKQLKSTEESVRAWESDRAHASPVS